jgi:hypothetical protein
VSWSAFELALPSLANNKHFDWQTDFQDAEKLLTELTKNNRAIARQKNHNENQDQCA